MAEFVSTVFDSPEAQVPSLVTFTRSTYQTSSFADKFDEIDTDFRRKVSQFQMRVQSMVLGQNTGLEGPFNRKRESFIVMSIPAEPEIWYYNMYAGKNEDVLWNIVKRHFKPFRNHSGSQAFGKGIYLHKRPDVKKGAAVGVVACRVLPGNKRVITEDVDKNDIPEGYQSKLIQHANTGNLGDLIVITNPDQILPLAAITCSTARDECKSGFEGGARNNNNADGAGPSGQQGAPVRDAVTEQMGRLFENSLKLHLTGQHMKACEAITTPLYPHQMYALAWMANRENSNDLGMKVKLTLACPF